VAAALASLRSTLSPATRAAPLFVGLSGGRDSLALLHVLRFFVGREGHRDSGRGGAQDRAEDRAGAGAEDGDGGSGWGWGSPRIHAIHVDHGIHAKSRAHARWVQGLCRGWQVPLTVATLPVPPAGEAAARDARYAQFRSVMEDVSKGPGVLLLAHHAEDQAETVLFRLLRGTGPRGLAGMPRMRTLSAGSDAIVFRPFLGVSGEQIAEWGRRHDLRPREDPTNRDPRYRRNWIRETLLPALGPEGRDLLLAIASEAAAREAVLARLLAPAEQAVVVRRLAPTGVTVDRRRLNLYPLPVRAELLRAILRGMGARISRRGIDMALAFLASAAGRGELTAAPGVRMVREGRQASIFLRAGTVQDEGPEPRGKLPDPRGVID
jgi:tRNA(Ile)-lysidine synthetase-like protein